MSLDKVEVKQEVDSEEESMEEETTQKVYVKVEGVKVLVGEGRMVSLACKAPQKRKMREDETPKEKEVTPPKKRTSRAARKKEYRERQRLKETPEEREERRRKARECKREQRRRQREAGHVPKKKQEKVWDEKAEERHRRKIELQRARRRNETPEQTAERRRKGAEAIRRRREEERRLLEKVPETEEEKKKRRELEEKRKKVEFNKLVKQATMTEEEKEAARMKRYLYEQAYIARGGGWKDKPERVKEKVRRQAREWRQNLEGERKERYKESLKKAQKKYFERLKNEGSWEKYPYGPEYRKMRAERMKAKGTWEGLRERIRESQRIRYAKEKPEEREKRRWREKVNAARRRLKKQLQEEEVGEEEIGRRDEELRVQMWREFDPDTDWTQKKPRGRKPREWAASVPTKLKAPEDKQKEQGQLFPNRDKVRLVSFSWPPNSLQNKGTQPCTAPGGNNDDVIEGDEDHFSPPPSPDSPPSPSHSESDSQETTDPQSFPPSSFVKDLSPPPVRSRDTVQYSHCPLEFPTEPQIRTHILGCHPSKCWKCPKCQEVVLSPLELSQHYSTAHKPINQEPVPVPIKNRVNDNSGCNFLCICCPTDATPRPQFETRVKLFAHVKLKHRKSFWPCKHCSLLKYSRKSLDLHLQICGYSRKS